jgi:hypothetical protein
MSAERDFLLKSSRELALGVLLINREISDFTGALMKTS